MLKSLDHSSGPRNSPVIRLQTPSPFLSQNADLAEIKVHVYLKAVRPKLRSVQTILSHETISLFESEDVLIGLCIETVPAPLEIHHHNSTFPLQCKYCLALQWPTLLQALLPARDLSEHRDPIIRSGDIRLSGETGNLGFRLNPGM
ncbi:hypothetical protein AVEN_222605-1 [Araneus ventricosus]|uniref:Uncharacterized protein n=1 Tax=Araneus ventricosus TaxID=182803 RepID=A0A4Y2T3Z1_ARAVE|nr:hypothetical protein AVEN_222605-1 [Araneus ventricosus]